MASRTLASVTRATPQPGTGILHPFPSARLPHLDPFVFLDTGAPKQLGEESIYVRPHPTGACSP